MTLVGYLHSAKCGFVKYTIAAGFACHRSFVRIDYRLKASCGRLIRCRFNHLTHQDGRLVCRSAGMAD